MLSNSAFSKSNELILYLTFHESQGHNLTILNKILAVYTDGTQEELLSEKGTINWERDQYLLIRSPFNAAKFLKRLLFIFQVNFKEQFLSIEVGELNYTKKGLILIPLNFRFDSRTDKVSFLKPSKNYAKENLLFVLSEDGIVQIIDKSEGTVVDFILLEDDDISDLKLSLKYPKLYFIARRNNQFLTYDLVTGKLDSVLLKRGTEPVSLSLTLLNNGKEIALVAYHRSNNIAQIDLEALYESASFPAENGPIKVFVDPSLEIIKESRQEVVEYLNRFRNIYVLNYYSDSLTVYQMEAMSGKLSSAVNLKTGSKPVDLFSDYYSGTLFILNQGSSYLNVGFVPMLYNSPMGFLKLEGVGFGAISGDYDRSTDRLYLIKEGLKTLIIARHPFTGTVYSDRIFILDEVKLDEEVKEVRFDPETRVLYLLSNNNLIFFDPFNKKVLRKIPLVQKAVNLHFLRKF